MKITKSQLKKMIQEAVREQTSRRAPLPKWGVHSTPEKSPWGMKEPSEWYPEDDGSEDSDLEPFPWEQEAYDKHNASISEQLSGAGMNNLGRRVALMKLKQTLRQNPEMSAEDLVDVAANFLSDPDEIEEITLTALEKWGEAPLPKSSPDDAKRREWDQNNDDGTIYGEAVLKEQVSQHEEDYEYAANRLVAAVEYFKKTAYRDANQIGKGSMARMKLDEDSLHEAFLSLKTIMKEIDGVRDAITAANIDDEY